MRHLLENREPRVAGGIDVGSRASGRLAITAKTRRGDLTGWGTGGTGSGFQDGNLTNRYLNVVIEPKLTTTTLDRIYRMNRMIRMENPLHPHANLSCNSCSSCPKKLPAHVTSDTTLPVTHLPLFAVSPPSRQPWIPVHRKRYRSLNPPSLRLRDSALKPHPRANSPRAPLDAHLPVDSPLRLGTLASLR